MKAMLESLLDGQDLSAAESGELLSHLTDPDGSQVVKAAVLAALRTKGETPAELRGMALAMRAAAVAVTGALPQRRVDTCGTGGDGSHAINVSTAAALVVAACGVPVAKHGNRSVSSKSGSADVLEALGVPLTADPDTVAPALADPGFAFLFAPAFHPAMRTIVPVRRALGVRTVFNLLGPLCNPVAPPFQLVGAFSERAAELIAGALAGMEIERAFVVHGTPHWDEATPMGPFHLWDVKPGSMRHEVIDPETRYGIARCVESDLAGGSASDNADALRRVFAGQPGPQRDAIVLNAALVLELVGEAQGHDAVHRAGAAIDDGAVAALLTRLCA